MTLKFVIHNFYAYLATFESVFTTYLATRQRFKTVYSHQRGKTHSYAVYIGCTLLIHLVKSIH